MVRARVSAIATAFPEYSLANEELALAFPEWSVDKIAAKTGINARRQAGSKDSALTLAVAAVERLQNAHDLADVDFVIVCTQSAAAGSPSVAEAVSRKIGMRAGVGAAEFNLGCSGFVYALNMAKGLVEAEIARTVLVVTTDTYTKFLNENDKSVRTIFGDGAAATLLVAEADEALGIHSVVTGTDGSGAGGLIVPFGGQRNGVEISPNADPALRGLDASGADLYMDGPAIFNFTIARVPEVIQATLAQEGLELDDIDHFVFHQANEFMLSHLRKRLKIPAEKFVVEMADVGNTVSSTIPIALSRLLESGRLVSGQQVMVVGFGVGLSWACATIRW